MCGGDDGSCTGCDGVLNSGREYDRCRRGATGSTSGHNYVGHNYIGRSCIGREYGRGGEWNGFDEWP